MSVANPYFSTPHSYPLDGPQGRYLVWHGSEITAADSLASALRLAYIYFWDNEPTFDFIEGPAGVVPEKDVSTWLSRTFHEEHEKARERRETPPGPTFHVMVRKPDGDGEARYARVYSREWALSKVRELNLPGRVRVYSTTEKYGSLRDPEKVPVFGYGDEIPAAEEGTRA